MVKLSQSGCETTMKEYINMIEMNVLLCKYMKYF